MSFSHGS